MIKDYSYFIFIQNLLKTFSNLFYIIQINNNNLLLKTKYNICLTNITNKTNILN